MWVFAQQVTYVVRTVTAYIQTHTNRHIHIHTCTIHIHTCTHKRTHKHCYLDIWCQVSGYVPSQMAGSQQHELLMFFWKGHKPTTVWFKKLFAGRLTKPLPFGMCQVILSGSILSVVCTRHTHTTHGHSNTNTHTHTCTHVHTHSYKYIYLHNAMLTKTTIFHLSNTTSVHTYKQHCKPLNYLEIS